MNDSIDMVIEEWQAQPGCSVSYRDLGIAFDRGASMVAAWRRAGPKAVLLGYLQTGAGAPREAGVESLRAALGLPAWVAPPAPTQEEPEEADGPCDWVITANDDRTEWGLCTTELFAEKMTCGSFDLENDLPRKILAGLTAQEAREAYERYMASERALLSDEARQAHIQAAHEKIQARITARRAMRSGAASDRQATQTEANTQALVAGPYEQVEHLLQQAASLKWERDEARLRVGELEREAGRREMERAEAAEADLAAFRRIRDAACCARDSARERANRTEAALAEAHRAVTAILIENNWPNTGGDAFASLKAAVDAAREQFNQKEADLEEARQQLRQAERVEEALRDALTSCDEARLRVGELEREAGRREMEMERVRRRSRSNAHALNTARVLVAEALRMVDAREELDEAKGRFARAHAAYREAEVCDDGQP